MIGLLFLVNGITGWALFKLRKVLIRTFRQRDRCRMIATKYKSALDFRDIKVDISDIDEMFKDDLAEESAA
jgi:hypothetical protein